MIRSSSFVFGLLVFALSCRSGNSRAAFPSQEPKAATPPAPSQDPTITELLVKSAADPTHPEFTILLAAVKAGDPTFVTAFNERFRRATVFAPTDAAFKSLIAKLNTTPEAVLGNRALVNALLAYHVLPCTSYDSATLRADNNGWVSSLLPDHPHAISIVDGKVVLDHSATVISADVPVANGSVHVVDQVLVPNDLLAIAGNFSSFPIPRLQQPVAGSLADALDARAQAPTGSEFKIFDAAAHAAERSVAAFDSAGTQILVPLYERLYNEGLYSSFIPTDGAFTAAGYSARSLVDAPESAQVLKQYLIPGLIQAATLRGLTVSGPTTILSLGGKLVSLSSDPTGLIVNGGHLIAAELKVTNGYLNTTDHALSKN